MAQPMPQPSLPFILLLFLLSTIAVFLPNHVLLANALEVETRFSQNGPSVCLSSPFVIPKYVNAICVHRGKRYIGGFFNRIGTEPANSFAVLYQNDTIEHLGYIGASSDLENVRRKGKDANFAGIITTLACPPNDDYIYIGGVFQNVSNAEPYNLADEAYGRDEDASTKVTERQKNSGFIANNIARYNTVTRTLEPLTVNVTDAVTGNTTAKIGFTGVPSCSEGSKACSQNDNGDFAMVRTITCAADGGNSCRTMFVGGYFGDAMGIAANSVARVEEKAGGGLFVSSLPSGTSLFAGDNSTNGVEGAVVTIAALDENSAVIGGVFSSTDKSGSPYMFKYWTAKSGQNCVLSTTMSSVPQCLLDHPPTMCCEPAVGTVFSSLKLSSNEVAIGGEFLNTLSFDFNGAEVDPVSGSASTNVDIGYQNFAVLPLANYGGGGAVIEPPKIGNSTSEDMFGGPNGAVLAMVCARWDVVLDRCVEIIISGDFSAWDSFDVDVDTLKISTKTTIECPQGIIGLNWLEDYEHYYPVALIPHLMADELGPIFDRDSEARHAVHALAIDSATSEIYAGGNFPVFNNLFKFSLADGFVSLPQRDDPVPDVNAYTDEKLDQSPFIDCMNDLVNRHDGNVLLDGAGFCCRVGSYCPDLMIDIQCPYGWGYFCQPWDIGQCPEGYYCEEPGRAVKCPKGFVCGMGSVIPRKCDFFELCPKEGLAMPESLTGLVLAAMVLSIVFSSLILGVKLNNLLNKRGKKLSDATFEQRFNAFTRNIKVPAIMSTLLNKDMTATERNTMFSETIPNPATHPEQKRASDIGTELQGTPVDHSLEAPRPNLDESDDDLTIGDEEGEKKPSGGKGFQTSLLGRETISEKERVSKRDTQETTSPIRATLGSGSERGTDAPEEVAGRIAELKVDLAFRNLSVDLASGLRILNNVTGRLEAGKMTAIMGPSGCGKSTMLNALTNRIKDGGKVSGKIWINGEDKPLRSISHLVGFVPQEDTMHRDLTVRENLRFYARLKADPRLTRNQRRAFVNEVIDILGLKDHQHTIIGDDLVRGVSGGQRKRVNIGIELMGSPLLLFLDEPTSGLDATTTQLLIGSLEKLANMGLAIAMVIHQPRMEVLNKISNLILLQKGGFPVFIGPTKNALPYFENWIGVKLPPQTTTADFFLDVITADEAGDKGSVADAWLKYKETVETTPFDHDLPTYRDRVIPEVHRPNRIKQAHTFYLRSLKQMINSKLVYFTDACMLIIAGALAGTVSRNNQYLGNQILMVINGIMSVIAALKVFGGEEAVFLREMSSGISSLSYFIGKCAVHGPWIFLGPMFFLATFYRMGYPHLGLIDLYLILVCAHFSGSGLGYFISCVVKPKSAQLCGVLSGLCGMLFSGLNPTLTEIRSNFIGQVITSVSYGPWLTGALFIREAKYIFPAAFSSVIWWTSSAEGANGFHNVDASNIYSRSDIYAAQIRLAAVYRFDLCILLAQYFAFASVAYALLLWKAKSHSGLLGWSAIYQGFRANWVEPIVNYLNFGTFTVEMTRREKEMLEFAKKKKMAKKILAENERNRKKREEEKAAQKTSKAGRGAGNMLSDIAENMASKEASNIGGAGSEKSLEKSDSGKGKGFKGFGGIGVKK